LAWAKGEGEKVVHLSAIGMQPSVRVLPLNPNMTTVPVMDGLFTAQAPVCSNFAGPWEETATIPTRPSKMAAHPYTNVPL